MVRSFLRVVAATMVVVAFVSSGLGQIPIGTAFTYQGELAVSGTPATGTFDLRFHLYDDGVAGNELGTVQCFNDVAVTGGRFIVALDFGAQFAGQKRWLGIEVRAGATGDCTNVTGYTALTPRQELTPAPHALYAATAGSAATAASATTAATATSASNATNLNGQAASFYQNAANLSAGTVPDARFSGAYTGVISLTNAGNSFTGSGLGLTSLNASNIASGTLANARTTGTSANTASTLVLRDASGNFSAGTITGTHGGTHTGDGSGLTGLSASSLSSGTVADGRLSSNVALLGGAQSFTGAKTFAAAPAFTSAGSPFTVSNSTLVTNLNASFLNGLSSSAFLQAVPNPLALVGSSTTHIIRGENTLNFLGASGVSGVASNASGGTYGVSGVSASTGGYGVYGRASSTTGFGRGGHFESASSNGTGVWGWATATGNLFTTGVFGESDADNGRGVYGDCPSAAGFTYGVFGRVSSVLGTGVYGTASATTGFTYGVSGEAASSTGRGVYGFASSTSGFAFGAFGEVASNDGTGVYGKATSTAAGSSYGGRFESAGSSGQGVLGLVTTNGTVYGVRGVASVAPVTGYGLYATGNSGASGTKSFRIDHPSDPANKYLLHYCAEGPEPQNIYNGTVTLDAAGGAVVGLPAYFAKVNTDPRYTLTAVGAAMPMLHIGEEIGEHAMKAGGACSFRIAGGVAGKKVCWEVKAARNDAWVRAYGAPVEMDKQGPEKGTYQHPELFGQPPESAMGFIPPTGNSGKNGGTK